VTTKATRDVVDFKTRAITDGLVVDGDCSANFALNGISVGLTTPCDGQFLDLVAGSLQVTGPFNMNGARIINMGAPISGQDGANKAYVDAALGVGTVGNDFIPLGVVIPFAGDTAPAGWLICNGDTVGNAISGAVNADAVYEDIFDFIKNFPPNLGTEDFSAGDTVVLPDLRGKTAVGVDATSIAITTGDAAFLGDQLGIDEVVLTEAEMPVHTHSGTTGSAGAHAHTYQGHGGGSSKNGCCTPWDSPLTRSTSTAGAHVHSLTIDSAGNGEAHTNVQPSVALHWIIKTVPSVLSQDVILADGSVSMDSGANLQFSGGGTPTGLPIVAVGTTDAVSKQHLDNALAALSFDSDYIRLDGTNTPTSGVLTLGANLDVANNRLTNVPDVPAAGTDAVNENLVDSKVSTAVTGYVTHLGSASVNIVAGPTGPFVPSGGGGNLFSDPVLLSSGATIAIVYVKAQDSVGAGQIALVFEPGVFPQEVWVPTTLVPPGDWITQQVFVPITTPGSFIWDALSPGAVGEMWLVGYVR